MSKFNYKKNLPFIIAVLVLFIVPVYFIFSSNEVLYKGQEYKFKVEAFDPYDFLRGNYIYITFKEDEVFCDELEDDNNSNYYVTINRGHDGYAYFDKISLVKPESDYYFETSGYYSESNHVYRIDTPVRYYMNENKSLSAEELYNKNIENTYVKVRVYKGKMVIVGVYVNDQLIDSIV